MNSFTLSYSLGTDEDGADFGRFDLLLNAGEPSEAGLALASFGVDPFRFSEASALFIRAVNRRDGGTLNLTGLSFSSEPAGDVDLGDIASTGVEILSLGGVDFTVPWTLAGNFELFGGSRSDPAFQIKVTDGVPAPIPLPAPLALMLVALGGLGIAARKRRAAA